MTIGAALTAAVERWGSREAYTFADRRLTFNDADAESDAIARALLLGVRRGDYVAVWMANHPEWVGLYFGVLKIGAILVPLSTRYRPDELAYALNKVRASILLFKREVRGRTDYGDVLSQVMPRVPTLNTIVDFADSPMSGTLSFSEFLKRGTSTLTDDLLAAERAVQPNDPAIVMYTSGTTSLPKAALLSHEGIVHSVQQSCRRLRLTDRDTFFSVQPVYHGGGALGVMMRGIPSGCRVVTLPYFEPGAALDALEREHVTVMSGHQPHYVEYLNHPTLQQRKLSLDRAQIIGPPEIYWRVLEKMGIEHLVNGYGMTETHLVGTGSDLDDSRESRFNTVGRPSDGVEIELRDPVDGRTVGVEQEGEIFLRVPYPMLGYLGEPEMTTEVLDVDGWYRTGDRGVVRKDGCLVLLGRVRDVIRVGGENVSAAEVEEALLAHPDVKQAAAIAARDERLGEVVVAFIELKPEAPAREVEIIEHCRKKLAHFKVPRAVHFVAEWPMTGSGKVQKRLLLDAVQAADRKTTSEETACGSR
jgi:acyl-CoA synthetase (AMP-forming)/AMP-acid ligase II